MTKAFAMVFVAALLLVYTPPAPPTDSLIR